MRWIINNIKSIKNVVFFILCWLFGIVLINTALNNIDLNKPNEIPIIFLVFLLSGIILLFFPFFKKIKVGSIELERELEKTKNELRDFKSEVRQLMSVISTNVNTIGNLNNHINLYLPGSQEIKQEISTIKAKEGEKNAEVKEIEDELLLPEENNIMSLAKTRIRLEFLLRKILEKRLKVDSKREIKFIPLHQLVREFIRLYPQYSYLEKSFELVTRVCNAAIHAQQITDSQTIKEVLVLGANIIAVLNDIEPE